MAFSMEQRVRRAADRMSSRSHAVRPKFHECKKPKCEEEAAVQGHCFAHWLKARERGK